MIQLLLDFVSLHKMASEDVLPLFITRKPDDNLSAKQISAYLNTANQKSYAHSIKVEL